MKIWLPRASMLLLVTACLLTDCGGREASTPAQPSAVRTTSTPSVAAGGGASSAPFTLVGAGDIAMCGFLDGAYQTGALLDKLPGTVFTMGDDAQINGTPDEYANCYSPTWGRQLDRTRPAPGNHDYQSGGAAYYNYFGSRAGPAGLGYYSYNIGAWRVYSLNSEVPSQSGSPQAEWLREELATNRSHCTLAYWHRPLFSSGKIGNNTDMRDLWRILAEYDVDVVVNGHDHFYERFAPQDPDGQLDPDTGIREFIVGTGGAPLSGIANVKPNSEIRANTWGVIVFTLSLTGYEWKFIPSGNSPFSDAGSGSCH